MTFGRERGWSAASPAPKAARLAQTSRRKRISDADAADDLAVVQILGEELGCAPGEGRGDDRRIPSTTAMPPALCRSC